jgi:FkbM family methyltransferase
MNFVEKLRDRLRYIRRFGFVEGNKAFVGVHDKKALALHLNNFKQPIYLREGSSDGYVFEQIFVHQEYNVKLKTEPTYIIDGGGNTGLSAVYFQNRFPKSKIIVVEPDKENFEQLKRNTQKYDNIFAVLGGLWNHKMYAEVVDKFQTGKWGMSIETVQKASETSIETFTIDELIKKHNFPQIDLLKLDIEGAEKELFEDHYRDWLSVTKVLVIELHENVKEGCTKTLFQAINNTWKNYHLWQTGENLVIYNTSNI